TARSRLSTRWPSEKNRAPLVRRAALPIEAVIVDQAMLPVYLRLGEKARHLWELGMSDRAIARALGVSDKTVTRAAAGLAAGRPGSV
ncbi:MAG TPA: hypothetical protein VJ741_01900, partial [Solirubrobacteraceae bacterium]|nr:hypothetical protein [Solirubrobacteraceae bacterium]